MDITRRKEFIKNNAGIFMLIVGVLGAIVNLWAMFFAFHLIPYGQDWAYVPALVTGLGMIGLCSWVAYAGWEKLYPTRRY